MSGGHPYEKVIINFAKILTVNFDMHKLFDYFMDSVMEIARVSKMSVMLGDKEGFRVKTHWGLDPDIADNLMLRNDSELVALLKKTGQIIHKPVAFADTVSINVKEEMEILQCMVSFPITHKGKLIGIFNIDNKVTTEPFYREELEIIYVLCNCLAAAIKDIDLYHQMWCQKEFTKKIISSMSSGMIAIDKDKKVTIFNHQASEILGLAPADIIGSGSEVLPSPLGDILYETMVKGTLYKRHEVTINPSKLPLGINSYRLLDEQQNPVGAGIVFSDLSDFRKLQEQSRKADKLEAVNDLMAKVAHEVRNPLTSIQTYTQLLNEKYTDDELKDFFISAVTQSINRLDSLIDRLVTFSSTQEYNFKKEEINDIVNGAEDLILKILPQTHKFSKKLNERSFYVNADKKQLIKAIYYLVMSIVDRTYNGTFIKMSVSTAVHDVNSVEISISYSGDSSIEKVKQNLLKPVLDINNLGTDLNVPISNKIIQGHNGSLDMKDESNSSAFVIKLPIFSMRSDTVSIKREQIGEE